MPMTTKMKIDLLETPDDFTCRLQELMTLHSAMIAMKDLEIESLKSELAGLRFRNQLLESLRKEAMAATGGARDAKVKKLGIVDPFLTSAVERGQKFWLVVYPRQISSLRHVWAHPDFPDEIAAPLVPQAEDDAILREGAGSVGIEFHEFMTAVGEYISDRERGDTNQSICFGYDINYPHELPTGFWGAYERVTGRSIPESWRDVYFRCAC